MAVAREVAEEEISAWLDYKKVGARKRSDYADQIDTLINAVADGDLVYDDERHLLRQKLKFPIGEDATISEFEYMPRLRVGAVHSHLQGVKATDADGRVLAYVAALTGQAKGVIKAIDTEDYTVASSIVVFFL